MKATELFQKSKECRVGFIGGSITEGAGASMRDCRFSSLVTAAFAARFPECKVEEINAGVGGTPSALGMFRLERDIIEKDPSIVFVEFAVNDGDGVGCDKYMEAIVRTLLRYKRDLPIVFLYTFASRMYETYLAGDTPPSVCVHHTVARHYNIPEINLGPDFAAKIEAYGGSYLALMKDGAHPNDRGYATYTDTIMREFFRIDFDIRFPAETVSGIDYPHPHMELAESIVKDGWGVSLHSFMGRLPNYIYASTPGTTLTYEYDGRALGAYITIEKDSGDADVYIDGKFIKTVSTWDEYALRFNRAAFVMLAETDEGHHTLTLVVSDKKNERSEGHFIRIGAFLTA